MKPSTQNIIEVKDITKKFGDVLALHNISFTVKKGEMLAIIGPNGSGKSTLMHILLGLETATKGRVKIHSPHGIRDVGYVPQRFFFDRSIPITVGEFLELQGCKKKEHAHKHSIGIALRSVGADHLLKQKLGTLSGGQLQRVLIARALLHEKQILILDEPNSHIDSEGEQAMYDLLKKLNQEHGVTVIVVSHELEFVSKYADTVLCINCSLTCHGDPKKTLTEQALGHLYACTDCK